MTHVAMNLLQHLSHVRWSSCPGLPQGLRLLTARPIILICGQSLMFHRSLLVVLAVAFCAHIENIMLLMLFPTLFLCPFKDDRA